MKSLKKGFTLAEILITLSIIGIIAALLIPQLVDNTKKNQYGATLGRAIQQIELGISNMIQQVNNNLNNGSIVTTIDTITVEEVQGNPFTNNGSILSHTFRLFQTGEPYMGIIELDQTTTEKYYEKSDTNFKYNNVRLFKFDKFNAYAMYAAQKGGQYQGNDIYTTVSIDVNGDSKPNKKGRDIFAFGLTTSGKMIPAGTLKMKDFTQNVTNDLGEVPLAENGCQDENITNAWSCTARVIQDGFKINY